MIDKKTLKPKKKIAIIGIYMIYNSAFNRRYIGSSTNVYRRLKNHQHELSIGAHNNRLMQYDYDKVGSNCFHYILVEQLKDEDKELLTAYEKYYIFKYNAIVKYKGYNHIMPTTNHDMFKQIYNLKENTNVKKTKENKDNDNKN